MPVFLCLSLLSGVHTKHYVIEARAVKTLKNNLCGEFESECWRLEHFRFSTQWIELPDASVSLSPFSFGKQRSNAWPCSQFPHSGRNRLLDLSWRPSSEKWHNADAIMCYCNCINISQKTGSFCCYNNPCKFPVCCSWVETLHVNGLAQTSSGFKKRVVWELLIHNL